MKFNAEKRNKLSNKEFALPEARADPIKDFIQAREDVSRAGEEFHKGNLTQSQYDEIVKKAERKIHNI